MDLPLQRLQHCHLSRNWPERSHAQRAQVQAAAPAAAANAPISLAQRALLQTARRNRTAHKQGADVDAQKQAQHKPTPQLHSELLHGSQLLEASPEQFQQLMDEHQRRQHLRLRQQQQQLIKLSGTARGQHAAAKPQSPPAKGDEQQHQSAGFAAEPQDQLQQRQLLQQHLALRQLILQQQQRKRQLQLQLRREPEVLTALIKRSTSWQRLQQLFTNFTPLFNPVHVSAAITHLAQLQPRPLTSAQFAQAPEGFQQLVKDLTAAAVACTPDYGPRQVTNSLWAIYRLGASELLTKRTRNAFMDVFQDKMQYAAPQHVAVMATTVANLAAAAGQLNVKWSPSPEWRQALLQAAELRLPYFKPLELAILLHGIGRLGLQPSEQWMSMFVTACFSSMYSFSMQELSMVAVSLARLQHRPDQHWLAVFMHAVQLKLAPHADAGAAAAFTNAGAGPGSLHLHSSWQQHHHHQDQAAAACQHSLQHELYQSRDSDESRDSDDLDAAVLQDYSSSGSLEQHHGAAETSSAAASGADAGDLEPSAAGVSAQGLVQVLQVLARWEAALPGGLRQACFATAERLCSRLTMQGVSTLLWAFAKLQLQLPQPLLLQVLQQAQSWLPGANGTDLAMLTWSLGTMGITAADLAASPGLSARHRSTRNHSSRTRSGGDAGSHVQVLPQPEAASDALQGSCPQPAWHAVVFLPQDRAVGRASICGTSGSSSRPGRSWGACWLSDLLYHSYRALPIATAADVSSLLVGVVRMRLNPGPQWLSSALVEVVHRLPYMMPTELASTLMCLARLHCKPSTSFLQAYCNCSRPKLAATAAAGRSKSSLGSMQHQSSGTSTAASNAAASRLYTPQQLANTLGAMALLGYKPPDAWSSSFFAASAAVLPGFNGRDFAYTIWALALLELRPPQAWMDAYLVHLRGHVPTMTSHQLSAVICGLAQLNHRPGVDWMNRFLDRVAAVVAQTPQQQGGDSSSRSSSSADNCSMLAPPSPLQLSGYFSAIILQGLTAWAASCLELGFAGSAGNSSSSSEGAPPKRKTRRRSGRTVDSEAAVPTGSAQVMPHANKGAAGYDADVTRDGCIVFRF